MLEPPPRLIQHTTLDLPALKRHGIAVQSFRNYRNTRCTPHQIDVLLVSLIVRGRARHVMEDAEFEASAGSVGITRPGESHDIVTGRRGIDVYNIYLDPARYPVPLAPPTLRALQPILFPENNRFRHLLNRSIHFQLRDPDPLAKCVEMILAETQREEEGSQELIAALLKVFVITCCRAARESGIKPSVSKGQPVPRWVLDLCHYMDTGYADPITLDGLCRRSGLSRGYLCRAFKGHVGMTTGNYLLHRRMEAAMQALRGGPDKILTIAMECGFRDLSHFNRTFRKMVGRPPSAYRNREP